MNKSNEKFGRNNFAAELTLLAQNVIRALLFATVQDLILEKGCRVNMEYSETTCKALISRKSAEKFVNEERSLQQFISTIMMCRTILETSVPIFLALIIGAWSDKYGRKFLMLFNLFGCIAESLALVLISTIFSNFAGAWTVAIVSSVFTSVTGGGFCFKMAILNYISDHTTTQGRTNGLGRVFSFLYAGRIFGLMLAGKFAKMDIGGLGFKFFILALAQIILFAYVLAKISNGIYANVKFNFKIFCELYNFGEAKNSLRVLFKKRSGNSSRKILLMLLAAQVLVATPRFGEAGLIYLFGRYQFNWTTSDVSYYKTYKQTIGFIGSLIAIPILQKIFNVKDDTKIGIIACCSSIMSSLSMAVGFTFIGPVIGIFSSASTVIPRAQISKIIPKTEMGKFGSVMASLECLNLLMSEIIYHSIYKLTFDIFPATFFLVSAILMILPIFIFCKI